MSLCLQPSSSRSFHVTWFSYGCVIGVCRNFQQFFSYLTFLPDLLGEESANHLNTLPMSIYWCVKALSSTWDGYMALTHVHVSVLRFVARSQCPWPFGHPFPSFLMIKYLIIITINKCHALFTYYNISIQWIMSKLNPE